jgi:hypothetical protein
MVFHSVLGTFLTVSSLLSSRVSASSLQSLRTQDGFYPLEDEITTDGLIANLVALEEIAQESGNNRAFGRAGFDRSRDFIVAETSKVAPAGGSTSARPKVSTQDFVALYNDVVSLSLSINDRPYTVTALTYSPSTNASGITAPLIHAPKGNISCTDAAYSKLDVKGKIVLVERAKCPDNSTFAGRIRPAAKAGAAAVIIYSNEATNLTGGTLTRPDPSGFVPSALIQQKEGRELVRFLESGVILNGYFQQTQIVENKTTQNVFAETVGGDPRNVIMLGAHLDSVQAGPGINDDGSGSTLLLEIFKAIQKFDVKNKVRFAWWGAEENGKLGSIHYANHLNKTELDNIRVYLNFDMVAQGFFGVYDGDGKVHGKKGPPGSEIVQQLFTQALAGRGVNYIPRAFTGGSDYQAFFDLGKPIGGVHTGTTKEDFCYHQACDTVKNINNFTITTNAKVSFYLTNRLICSH